MSQLSGSLALKGFLASLAVGAAASAPVFFQTPAQAACLASSGATNCSTFEGSSVSNVENFGYTDTDFIANGEISAITFVTGASFTSPLPLTLTNIAYSFDAGSNWLTTNLGTSVTLTSANVASANLLSASVLAPGGAVGGNFRLRWTIPAGVFSPTSGAGRSITSSVTSTDTATFTDNTLTRSSSPVPAPPTPSAPGPLPLLGAGAAFGFSRKLRQRIKFVDQA